MLSVQLLIGPLAAAEAPSFLLIEKKQKIKSAKRLLCRTEPLPCKPGRTTGWNLLPYCVRSLPPASAKFPMPLPRTRPPSFCPLSPEAVLPTREKKESYKSTRHFFQLVILNDSEGSISELCMSAIDASLCSA
ncbi:hypothetical protein [Mucilaginibacter aquariorum]|uniref:Secreted protein n=1 Tax=Mucilaginibacter aquariorum TaxID=2967225 RepID=A0ABT1T2P5_9SPHI|nr:hypothetical protein [Mucilaginibacter aquariorum]MCQ6958834.1 hypothetical protein [Mucilaginibacter aquariorum]